MRFQLPLALLLTVPTVACTHDAAPADDPDTVAASLELENGGFDTGDEAPQFGDAELYAAAELEAEAEVSDTMAADPVVVELQANASAAVHDVVVMWGRMPADPAGTTRDWSGELRLSRGAMVIKRRIGFELATDRIAARTRPDAIQFESKTSIHADGLALTVLDPTPGAGPLTLTYVSASGAATHSLSLGTLADGPVVADAGDGNEIVAIGHRRLDPCARGFLRGRWHALTPNAGLYAGLIVTADGETAGHVRGIYGTRADGQAVFFGKLIGLDGSFRGIMGGVYGEGHFAGRLADRSGERGAVRGMYRAGATLRAGRFLGKWAETTCTGR